MVSILPDGRVASRPAEPPAGSLEHAWPSGHPAVWDLRPLHFSGATSVIDGNSQRSAIAVCSGLISMLSPSIRSDRLSSGANRMTGWGMAGRALPRCRLAALSRSACGPQAKSCFTSCFPKQESCAANRLKTKDLAPITPVDPTHSLWCGGGVDRGDGGKELVDIEGARIEKRRDQEWFWRLEKSTKTGQKLSGEIPREQIMYQLRSLSETSDALSIQRSGSLTL